MRAVQDYERHCSDDDDRRDAVHADRVPAPDAVADLVGEGVLVDQFEVADAEHVFFLKGSDDTATRLCLL